MTEMILSSFKAIETVYKGYRFRSRLEARWAVFFDELGIEWLYEPEGFSKPSDGDTFVRYLPDFYLPEFGTWVEVKGSLSSNDAEKLGEILDWGSPLTWFDDSWCTSLERTNAFADFRKAIGKEPSYGKFAPGLLILGEIPLAGHGLVIHKMITHHRGLYSGFAMFDGKKLKKLDQTDRLWLRRFSGKKEIHEDWFDPSCESTEQLQKHFSPETHYIKTALAHPLLMDAYEAARSARFEYGESGGKI
jgi:hypothetical protein